MKKKIIITGGAGFIGSHLAEKLAKNYKVLIIDNFYSGSTRNIKSFLNKQNVQLIKADILNLQKYENYFKNVEAIFHLAALADIVPSIENPSLYFDVNVKGTLNLLDLAKKHKVKKFIYAASSSCYGIPKKYPTSENAKIVTEYPYALTKRLGEELVLHWGKVYKMSVSSLRLFNVYGPRSRTSGAYGAVFGVFLAQKIFNKPFTVVGDGNQSRDFTYVEDVVDAFISTFKSKKTNLRAMNVGSGSTIKINKIVKILGGKKIYIPKRPGEPDKTFADIKLIKKLTQWKPKYNIKKGIGIMLKNLDYWKSAPLWNPKSIKQATKSWFKYLK